MTISGLIGLAFIIAFSGLIILFTAAKREQPESGLRKIPAFSRLRRAIGLAVEAGSRLHLSIGRGNLTGPESAVAFVGLSALEGMIRSASTGDNPPVATAGDPSLAILTRDTLSSTYRDIGNIEHYDPTTGQLAGFTPFSYAAGTLPIIQDEKTTAHILIGHFGNEVALITDASERNGDLTLTGTDNLPAQAILYATSEEPLIGEEVYASGAYLNAGPMHIASLRAQDIFRWVLIVVIILGVLFKLAGIDQIFTDIFGGLL
ncbi:MAG: hypothetical protein ISR58_00880 [Anaerolineales bacterium]|nr:hypothetical protein [Chloroflexota bacterium]MBL6979718.1 hypothetical protein [Anaerolineales bacterium]